MSTQIDSLDIQIKTSAGQSVENIEKLAVALEKLKDSSKLGQTARNLEKLSKSLESLSGKSGGVANLSRLADKMKSVSSATISVTTASQNAKKGFDMSSVGYHSKLSLKVIQGTSINCKVITFLRFPSGSVVKNLPANAGDPKKDNTKECSNYSTIALISKFSKPAFNSK